LEIISKSKKDRTELFKSIDPPPTALKTADDAPKKAGDAQTRVEATSSGEARVILTNTPRRIAEIIRVTYRGVSKMAVDNHPAIQKARAVIESALQEGQERIEVSLPLAEDVTAAGQKNAIEQVLAKDVVTEKSPKELSSHGAPKPTEAEASLRPKNASKPEGAKEKHFPEAPPIVLGDKKLQPQLGCYRDTRERMQNQYTEMNGTARALEELNGLLRQVFRLDSSAIRYFTRPGTAQSVGFQRELFLSMLLVRSDPLAAMRLLGSLFNPPTEMMHLIRLAHGQGLISKESAENLKRLMEQPEVVPILAPGVDLSKAEGKRKKPKKDSEKSWEQEQQGSGQHQQQPEQDDAEEEALLSAERDAAKDAPLMSGRS
jgi:ribosomal protein L19E